jgi:TetR/AcrR family transcriptional regulator
VTATPARVEAEEALLDAAERLLVEVGYAAITTRLVAKEAGVNHGLVHYYFGSMENLLLRVLERFTGQLIERQRAMYAADVPFLEKWRAAMGFLEEDIAAGYPKVWFELQAMAWNKPEFAERVARVDAEWRAVLTDAFTDAMRAYGIDRRRFPVDAVVALVTTFNLGMQMERLSGIDAGHEDLLAMIDRWLVSLERERRKR